MGDDMSRIVVGFEAQAERDQRLRVGERYIAVDRGARPEWDREYFATWDGLRGREESPIAQGQSHGELQIQR